MVEDAFPDTLGLDIDSSGRRVVELREFEWKALPRQSLSKAEGQLLQQLYPERFSVNFPALNRNDWELRSEGWVGRFPVTSGLTISISPKVPLGNLFRMLEYAYRLNALEFRGMTDSNSLDEFYERFAAVLAK